MEKPAYIILERSLSWDMVFAASLISVEQIELQNLAFTRKLQGSLKGKYIHIRASFLVSLEEFLSENCGGLP